MQSPKLKFKAAGGLIALLTLVTLPSPAFAQDEEGPKVVLDARIEGLVGEDGKVTAVDQTVSGGYSLTWITLLALGGLATAVMFKDAKRSHLD